MSGSVCLTNHIRKQSQQKSQGSTGLWSWVSCFGQLAWSDEHHSMWFQGRGRRPSWEQEGVVGGVSRQWVARLAVPCQIAAQLFLDFAIQSTLLNAWKSCVRALPNFNCYTLWAKWICRSLYIQEPALFLVLAGSLGKLWNSSAMCFPSGKFCLLREQTNYVLEAFGESVSLAPWRGVAVIQMVGNNSRKCCDEACIQQGRMSLKWQNTYLRTSSLWAAV